MKLTAADTIIEVGGVKIGPSLTKRQAEKLYQLGQEVVVFVLTTQAKMIAQQMANSPQSPAAPSSARPVYKKDNKSKNKRGKKIGAKRGHVASRRPKPLVYLHYVLDLWVQWWRKHIARGEVIIVRWADDFVMGFQYEAEARQFLKALRERFRKFSLELHPDKTRLIRFGRFARRDVRRFDGRKKPETFDFLGFTHFCGVNHNGKFMVGRITMKKRFTAKLQAVKLELRHRMHDSLVLQGLWLRSVVQGYFAYHAIPGNWDVIGAFRTQVARLWYRILRRRSQKTRLNWDRMKKHVDTWLPPARILHPWPDQRFDAMIRGRSPVR